MTALPMGTKSFDDPLGFDINNPPEFVDPTKEVFDKAAADLFNLNAAFLRLFSTPDGQVVMSFWEDQTIKAPTWMASLATDKSMDAACAHGFAREGQNALIRDAQARMQMAKDAKTPDDYIDKLQKKGSK